MQDVEAAARWLYEDAPFCVVAHNTDEDPRFIYANKAAQHCFEYSWAEMTALRHGFPLNTLTGRSVINCSKLYELKVLHAVIAACALPSREDGSGSRT